MRAQEIRKAFPVASRVRLRDDSENKLCCGTVQGYAKDHRGRTCIRVDWREPLNIEQGHYPEDLKRVRDTDEGRLRDTHEQAR